MNWYKQQSIIQKEAWNWDKATTGFWAGIAIGLASWLGISQLEIQNLKKQTDGDDQKVVQILKEEVQRQGGNPDQIIQELNENKIQEHAVQGKPQQATYEQLKNKKDNPEEDKTSENYIGRMGEREGIHNTAYDDKTGVITVGIGHAMGSNPGPENMHAKRSRSVFKKLWGNSVNWDDIYNEKASLTDEQVRELALYDINDHIERARSMFPQYETYPEYLQEALLDSVFRGDTGNKTTALINQGRWREAADEYINRKDYINAEKNGMRGIKIRMDKNRAAMLQYAKELGQ